MIRMIKYGVLLPWKGKPSQCFRREYPISSEDYRFTSAEMDRWIANGFAQEITESEARRIGQVVSEFLVRGSEPRVVVNYTAQNEMLDTKTFKMETLVDLAPQLRPNDALIKADIRDSHYHLRLRACDRDKLLFQIFGRFFRPLALNCRLSAAPLLFIKLLRPFIQELRRLGHRIISYLDDIPGAPRTDDPTHPATAQDANRAKQEFSNLFKSLGISLHTYKSDFAGRQELEMLGIMVDTQRELYLLLPDKIKKLSDASKRYRQNCIRRKRRSPLRDLQRFCGLANSTSLAVSDSRLYLRAFFNCAADQKTGQKVVLCHQSLRNLKWWANIAENQHIGRTIWEPTPKALLVTDASMEGWGAIWHEPTNQSKMMQYTTSMPRIRNKHISSGTRPVQALRRAAEIHKPAENSCRHPRYSHFPQTSQKVSRPTGVRLASNSGSNQKLDVQVLHNHASAPNPARPVQKSWTLLRTAVHPQCSTMDLQPLSGTTMLLSDPRARHLGR
jgi:hypothetical protein